MSARNQITWTRAQRRQQKEEGADKVSLVACGLDDAEGTAISTGLMPRKQANTLFSLYVAMLQGLLTDKEVAALHTKLKKKLVAAKQRNRHDVPASA